MKRDTTRADACFSIGIFALAFGYFFAFRRLGWFPQDEGVLYYQYLRTYHGQVPYRDFATGYPPLMYYWHAWIFAHVGISLQATRTVLAVVNAASAAALYAVTRRVAPRGLAMIPSLLFLVMQPGDITNMGFHNSPYPLWYAVTFTALGAWAMMRVLEAGSEVRRRAWLVVVGLFGGLTFLSKQNAGIFFLWGVTGFLASRPDPPSDPDEREAVVGRVVRWGYLALIPLASLFLVKNFIRPVTLAAFVIPLGILAVAGARHPFGTTAIRRLAGRFACLGVGFAVAFGPWLAYFSTKIGAGAFLRHLFFIGADVDRNLYVPFPGPRFATAVILLSLLAWALAVRMAGSRGRRFPALLLPAIGAFILGAILSQEQTIGDTLRLKFGLGEICVITSTWIDNLGSYLALLVLGTALAVAHRQEKGVLREGDPPPAAFLLLLWLAVTSFLLFYPRMDAAHLASASPLLYGVGAALFPRFRSVLEGTLPVPRRAATSRAFGAICLVTLLFVVFVKAAPKLYTIYMLKRTDAGIRIVPTPRVELGLKRADLYFPAYTEDQRRLVEVTKEVVRAIRRSTAPSEPIFVFPALPMLYFISERDNPTREDYFFGNNVSFRDQIQVIRDLEKAGVRTVVVPNSPSEYFVSKGKDFTRLIWDYLGTRYYLDRRIGPFDVLRRYGSEQPGSENRGGS